MREKCSYYAKKDKICDGVEKIADSSSESESESSSSESEEKKDCCSEMNVEC